MTNKQKRETMKRLTKLIADVSINPCADDDYEFVMKVKKSDVHAAREVFSGN